MSKDFFVEAFNAVGDMHQVFGHPVYNPNNPAARKLGEDVTNLRLSLINEEWNETTEAFCLQDKVEVADGLCDILVVALGAAHCLNISPKGSVEDLVAYPEDVISCLHNVGYYLHEESLTNAVAASVNLFAMADKAMPHLRLRENFWLVHETNMNKSFSELTDAEVDVKLYEEDGVVCSIKERPLGDKLVYVIVRDDGKVLKPKSWAPPTLVVD